MPPKDYLKLLEAKGLHFSGQDLKLQHIKDGSPLPKLSQKQFEKLGDTVTGAIQQLMREQYGMSEVWLPTPIVNGPKSNIFVSSDFYTNTDRCLVLIQGTGAVRAGMWARSVCINNDLVLGSVLPQLDFAKANGFSVIVLNPNLSTDPVSKQTISMCHTMESHCRFAWKVMMPQCAAKKLAIIAHSAGGSCVRNLWDVERVALKSKLKALVFTDSYYHGMENTSDEKELRLLANIGIHFKAYYKTYQEVGEILPSQNGPILEVSAGTDQHVLTTGVSAAAINDFLIKKFKIKRTALK